MSRSERKRVLLTGRNGFTGGYVAAALEAAGHDVIDLAHDDDPAGAGMLRADLLDLDAVRRAVDTAAAEIVVHLAGITSVVHGNVEAVYRTNIVGSRNLLAALAENPRPPHRVVLASSANIYGNASEKPIREDMRPAPANDYAVSKLAMEHMANVWMDRLPIMFVRPFNYTGVGQSEDFLIPKIVGHFRRGEPVIELGNIDVARDFSDVRDVARAYAAIVDQASAGQILNICCGVAHTLQDVLRMLADIAGYQINVRVNPHLMRSNDVKTLTGDNARLRALTGYSPSTALEDTLRWMYSA